MPLSSQNTVRDFAFGRHVIQASARQLLVDGQPARLGARAFDVLIALVERRDVVVSKNELFDTVWPGLVVEENNLQVQVSTLRKLLGPHTIVTIPGRGYRFVEPAANAAHATNAGETQPLSVENLAAPTLPSLGDNMAAHLPTLFGRSDELATLTELLCGGRSQRLITITGTGGMGKTCLARAAAFAVSQRSVSFPDGVWWFELGPVSDRALVLGTLARTLGITLDADDTVDELAARIAERQMLFVLDNCEHLIETVAAIAATLLRVAPRLTVLTTSQESMKVAGEYVLRLGALSLPSDAPSNPLIQGGAVDDRYGALVMFTARARDAAPKFVLDDSNRSAVVEICRRLDGIPLAIEFVAARLPLLGIHGLRLRLDDRFRLLTSGARLAPRRQQTLRAALEWSHSLLIVDEQKVFRRLGIFAGSFALDAAQHVAAGDDFDPWLVLDYLGALIDKSLVITEAGAMPRYRLLESARAFAVERMRAANEQRATAHRHAHSLLTHFDAAYAQFWNLHSDTLFAAALPEIDNLRAALKWAAGPSGDAAQLAALVGASGWLWKPANLTFEGAGWFEVAVDRLSPDTPAAVEAQLLLGYATLAHQADAHKEITALLRAGHLYRAEGDRRGEYESLVTLAQKQVWARDFAGAEQNIRDADALFDAAWPLTMREGYFAARTYLFEASGRPADGQPMMEALVAVMRASGDQRKLD